MNAYCYTHADHEVRTKSLRAALNEAFDHIDAFIKANSTRPLDARETAIQLAVDNFRSFLARIDGKAVR